MINYIDQFSPFPSDCWQLLEKETEERTKFAHFRHIFVFHIFPTHRAGVSGTPSSRPSATPVFQTASVPQRSTRPRTLTWRAQCGYGGNGMASHFQLRLLRLTSHVLAKRSARCRGKVARIEPKATRRALNRQRSDPELDTVDCAPRAAPGGGVC